MRCWTRVAVAPRKRSPRKRCPWVLSNGYGKLKEKTFRIAHMGDLQMSDIDELLGAIEEILKLK